MRFHNMCYHGEIKQKSILYIKCFPIFGAQRDQIRKDNFSIATVFPILDIL